MDSIMEGTASLRESAAQWSLAGDQALLDTLQGLHQRIITKCQETNDGLQNMVSALDEASISLQNVNNKFMSLSNSQFIECRVFDDDTDVAESKTPKEPPKATSEDNELDRLKHSLRVLEEMHECVTIVPSDSESDSDSEGDTRVVLKPRDLYSDRPLPYIIGSQAWKNKWHAGLLLSDSDNDSDSDNSAYFGKRESHEDYSASDPEPELPQRPADTISSTASSQSERDISVPVSHTQPSPSDIAAELARRLRGPITKIPEKSEQAPSPAVRKVYKPEKPATAIVFFDEPPPLDNTCSDSDGDIFAELHKNKPYAGDNKSQSVVEDLFGDNSERPEDRRDEGDIFSDFADKKKPAGGVSLFGNNANANNIGAAILQQKPRHYSTSGEDSDTATQMKKPEVHKKSDNEKIRQQTKKVEEQRAEKPKVKTENDIFQDLFAKTEKRKTVQKEGVYQTNVASKDVKETKGKVDLFKDDLFDDIDDIFTSNITKTLKEPVKNEQQKSIFDDDVDDDLFADIPSSKISESHNSKMSKASAKPSLFDSDDELFSEKATTVKPPIVGNLESNENMKNESLFDTDDGSDIFSEQTKPAAREIFTENARVKSLNDESLSSRGANNNIFGNNDNKLSRKNNDEEAKESVTPELTPTDKELLKPIEVKAQSMINSPDIFDDDDLFTTSTSHKNNDAIRNSINQEPSDVNIISPTSIYIEKKDTEAERKHLKKNLEVNVKSDKEDTIEGLSDIVKESSKSETDLFGDDGDDIFSKPEKPPKAEKLYSINFKEIEEFETASFDNDIKDDLFNDFNQTTSVEREAFSTVKTKKPEPTKKPHIIKPKPTNTKDSCIKEPEKDNVNIPTDAQNYEQTDTKLKNTITASISDIESSSQKESVETDIFPDVLFSDLPPVFEKPKEPKKSKNINALFDDDSDDEALFFRKTETLDEKPDSPVDTQTDNLFGIFHDEPPAIDVDFTPKTVKPDYNTDLKPVAGGLFSSRTSEDQMNDGNGFKSLNSKVNDEPDLTTTKSVDNMFNPTVSIKQESIDFSDSDDDLYRSVTNERNLPDTKYDTQNLSTPKSKSEPKKIGKLKPIALNINVNTLLPGASPKKTLKIISDETNNAQTNFKPKRTEEIPKSLDKDYLDSPLADETSKTVKAVSFEDPDSLILDNKLSKDRPKIQVKRRPSTRRARKEAATKSGIDFGEDTPDSVSNSSKKEEQKNEERDVGQLININKTRIKQEAALESAIDFEKDSPDSVAYSPKQADMNVADKNINATTYTIAHNTTVDDELENSQDASDKDIKSAEGSPTSVKSKVVYVLNDEDIFVNTKTIHSISKAQELTKNALHDSVKSDSESQDPKTFVGISTLGQVYKATDPQDSSDIFKDFSTDKMTKKVPKQLEKLKKTEKTPEKVFITQIVANKPKKSLFEDLSDSGDELFNTKTKKDAPKVASILDSEDKDLFTSKKKEMKRDVVEQRRETKKVVVKGSLFGDEDSDDDLFGAKRKNPDTEESRKPTTSRESSTKMTEPVFEDPLSMFGNDE